MKHSRSFLKVWPNRRAGEAGRPSKEQKDVLLCLGFEKLFESFCVQGENRQVHGCRGGGIGLRLLEVLDSSTKVIIQKVFDSMGVNFQVIFITLWLVLENG